MVSAPTPEKISLRTQARQKNSFPRQKETRWMSTLPDRRPLCSTPNVEPSLGIRTKTQALPLCAHPDAVSPGSATLHVGLRGRRRRGAAAGARRVPGGAGRRRRRRAVRPETAPRPGGRDVRPRPLPRPGQCHVTVSAGQFVQLLRKPAHVDVQPNATCGKQKTHPGQAFTHTHTHTHTHTLFKCPFTHIHRQYFCVRRR